METLKIKDVQVGDTLYLLNNFNEISFRKIIKIIPFTYDEQNILRIVYERIDKTNIDTSWCTDIPLDTFGDNCKYYVESGYRIYLSKSDLLNDLDNIIEDIKNQKQKVINYGKPNNESDNSIR